MRIYGVHKRKLHLLLCVFFFCVFTSVNYASERNSITIREILSYYYTTDQGDEEISDQSLISIQDIYTEFAADSDGNIYISDTNNNRIMRFSNKGVLLAPLIIERMPLFYPERLCVTENDVLYVYDLGKRELIAFSRKDKKITTYDPSAVLGRGIAIISLSCGKSSVTIGFEVFKPKQGKMPLIYLNEYDLHFNLIGTKSFRNESDFYEAQVMANKMFEKRFVDRFGNTYGYPYPNETYRGRFLPLQKYSLGGNLTMTINGSLLSRYMNYKIYDYFTAQGTNWAETQRREFIIVNWYVTHSGTIYALLANKEQVKVLRIIIG